MLGLMSDVQVFGDDDDEECPLWGWIEKMLLYEHDGWARKLHEKTIR